MGAAVAFFSLEMSADQLATRILAEQSGISSEALRMGKISREDFQQLSFASQRLAELPLFIDDTPGLTIAALRTRARRLKRRHDIGLIVVDYLQLLQGSGRAQRQPRQRNFRNLARAEDPGQGTLRAGDRAFAAFSRAVEQREDKRPMLSDLRESGSIEQDADMVWFVFREDYYAMATEPQATPPIPIRQDVHAKWNDGASKMERITGLSELIIAKQRHGATGKVRLRFEARITKFSDLAPEDMRDNQYDNE